MKSAMKVIIIGTIVKDKLKFPDGSSSSSLGGLLHTINAARAILGKDDLIVPVSRVGEDLYTEIISILQEDPRIESGGLIPCDQPNNTVELIYHNRSERTEKSLFPMPPLQFEEVETYLNGDLFLVNMISGWDVDLDFLVQLRDKTRAIIAIDLHSLMLQRGSDGSRHFRHFDGLEQWIACADIIQMNENEFAVQSSNKTSPEQFFREVCIQSHNIFNLTKGACGSETYHYQENVIHNLPTFPPAELTVVDPTGCGDVFLAGFGIAWYRSKNIRQAARTANILAAITGTFKGLPEPEKVRQMYAEYVKEDG